MHVYIWQMSIVKSLVTSRMDNIWYVFQYDFQLFLRLSAQGIICKGFYKTELCLGCVKGQTKRWTQTKICNKNTDYMLKSTKATPSHLWSSFLSEIQHIPYTPTGLKRKCAIYHQTFPLVSLGSSSVILSHLLSVGDCLLASTPENLVPTSAAASLLNPPRTVSAFTSCTQTTSLPSSVRDWPAAHLSR